LDDMAWVEGECMSRVVRVRDVGAGALSLLRHSAAPPIVLQNPTLKQ